MFGSAKFRSLREKVDQLEAHIGDLRVTLGKAELELARLRKQADLDSEQANKAILALAAQLARFEAAREDGRGVASKLSHDHETT